MTKLNNILIQYIKSIGNKINKFLCSKEANKRNITNTTVIKISNEIVTWYSIKKLPIFHSTLFTSVGLAVVSFKLNESSIKFNKKPMKIDNETNNILTNSILIFTKNIKINEINPGKPIILALSLVWNLKKSRITNLGENLDLIIITNSIISRTYHINFLFN